MDGIGGTLDESNWNGSLFTGDRSTDSRLLQTCSDSEV